MIHEDDWERKAWGWTRCESDESPTHCRHHLRVDRGGFSSLHYHSQRANAFTVTSGIVRVVWCFADKLHFVDLGDEQKEKHTVVPSLVPHQFQVLKSGRVIEDYWPDRGGEVRLDDIERLTVGGLFENFHSETPSIWRSK